MTKIAAVLVERLGLAVLAAAAVTLLHLYGELSLPASILLGGAFTIVGVWLYGLAHAAAFKPYRLIIGIRYASLWEDLKLTPTTEGEQFENVTLTAITPAIFARSDDRQYSAHPDIYKDVPCGAPAWRMELGDLKDVPTFFLRPHREGYQFGIHVQEEWWKQNSGQLAEGLRNLPFGYDRTIVLGLLPYGYIPDQVKRWNEPVGLFGGFDRKQRRWKKRLAQEGWTFDDDKPTRLTHRYLGIGYYDI